MITGDLTEVQKAHIAEMTAANQKRIDAIAFKHAGTSEPITREEIEFLLWRARP